MLVSAFFSLGGPASMCWVCMNQFHTGGKKVCAKLIDFWRFWCPVSVDFRLPAKGWLGSPSRGPQKKYDWLSARRGPQKMYDPVLGSPVMILRRNEGSQSHFFWGPFFEEPESYFFWGLHPGRSWPGLPKMDRGDGFPRGPFLVVSFFPPCAKLVHTNSTHACGTTQRSRPSPMWAPKFPR